MKAVQYEIDQINPVTTIFCAKMMSDFSAEKAKLSEGTNPKKHLTQDKVRVF